MNAEGSRIAREAPTSGDVHANGPRQNQSPNIRRRDSYWRRAIEVCKALEDGLTAERINSRAIRALSRGWFRRAPA